MNVPLLCPLSEHPSSIHTTEEASPTSSAFRPERFKKAVTNNGHQQLPSMPDLDLTRVAGRVEVGEVKNGTIGFTPPIQSPFSCWQLWRKVASGKLAGINGKLKWNKNGLRPFDRLHMDIFGTGLLNFLFYVGTPSGVHLFDHHLWSIFQSSITHYI